MSDGKILGVLVMARHGDRRGFYQDPVTYTPSATKITPLGNVQEYVLGQYLRDRYLTSSSPNFIPTINNSIVNLDQLLVRADAGGEGGVILASAMSVVQGLFPANDNYKITLANGTTVEGPLDGYQYVTIESVEPENDISLEGWTKCGAFDKSTQAFYDSPEFKQKAAESKEFLDLLPPFLDDRPVTLENMWNIFDYMLVEYIHDAEFRDKLPPTFIEQGRDLANWHEYGVFSDSKLDGIGNIAFRTMIPSVTKTLNSIANASNPLKFGYFATSYKPFISLFNMTGVADAHPELQGFVNFAGTIALEVREPAGGGDPVVRFTFKNGTEEGELKPYSWMNSTGPDVPLKQFLDYLQPASISSTSQWCKLCGNTKDRGCAEITGECSTNAQALLAHNRGEWSHRSTISPVGAGFIGAGATLLVGIATLAVLSFLGLLTIGKKGKAKALSSRASVSSEVTLSGGTYGAKAATY
ncbi:hypothetical protein V5O48_008567 [Marasmius crinis-equi]|uniref:Phosphoglycerate mutase-like protein n=1 Tax=Marasmius crinis-equi TaxID=585013 RepID=A0ABR3FE14_9AGAR